MKTLKWVAVAALLLLSIGASAQTIYNLQPLVLTNGWKVTGTITTDGTVGALTAANIVDWNLKVVQTTDFTWTEKNSTNVNSTLLSTDGTRIFVATSPDGVQDGGNLTFSRGGGGGRIATAAVLGDFTQLSTNLGYVGGMAGWMDEIWGLNFVGLNLRNNARFRAAAAIAGQPNVFRVTVPVISTTPLLMTMFGTITTDGTIGALTPQNIIAWNITARNQDITYYTKANSGVLNAIGVTTDGTYVKVARAGGQFNIGIGGRRPTFVTIADFTDPTYPDGFANYYMGNFGEMGNRAPLIAARAKNAFVAKRP
jgi:hypothetical protein